MLTQPVRRRTAPGRQPMRPPRRSAANDNRLLRVVPNNPRRLGKYGRALLRMNPYIRVAGDLLNILEWLSAPQSEEIVMQGAWRIAGQCASPRAGTWVYGGSSAAINASSLVNAANRCTQGQAYTPVPGYSGAQLFDNPLVGNGARTIGVGPAYVTGQGWDRMQYALAVTRDAGTEKYPMPFLRPASPAIALPANDPALWIGTMFPEQFAPGRTPAFMPAVPWALNPRWVAPNRQVSYGTSPARSPSRVPNDWAVVYELGERTGQAAPTTHKLAPPRELPPDYGKERKLKLSRTSAILLKTISTATEGLDFIGVLYDALPREYRPRYRNTTYERRSLTPLDKARAVYDNFEHIDLEKFLLGFIENHIEDLTYGQLGRLGADISVRLNKLYGSGFNPLNLAVQKYIYEYQDNNFDVDGEQIITSN